MKNITSTLNLLVGGLRSSSALYDALHMTYAKQDVNALRFTYALLQTSYLADTARSLNNDIIAHLGFKPNGGVEWVSHALCFLILKTREPEPVNAPSLHSDLDIDDLYSVGSIAYDHAYEAYERDLERETSGEW